METKNTGSCRREDIEAQSSRLKAQSGILPYSGIKTQHILKALRGTSLRYESAF